MDRVGTDAGGAWSHQFKPSNPPAGRSLVSSHQFHSNTHTHPSKQDFLERLQPLPNDVQRSFHLMRELDKDAADLHPYVL